MEISDNNFNTSVFFDTTEVGFRQIVPPFVMRIKPSFYDNQYNLRITGGPVLVPDIYIENLTNNTNTGKHLTITNNGKIQIGNLGNGLEIDNNGNLDAKPLGGISVGDGLELDLTTGTLNATALGVDQIGDGLELVNNKISTIPLSGVNIGPGLNFDTTTNTLRANELASALLGNNL